MSASKLKEAYEKLSPNNIEAGLPGRESQNQEIYNFVYERLKKREISDAKKARLASGQFENITRTHLNKTIFICGVPGTGKTATVLQDIYINGLHLSKPEKIYSEILNKITGENLNPDKAQDRLDSIFHPSYVAQAEPKRRASRKTHVKSMIEACLNYKVIIIDELDLLYKENRQAVFYNLFDWPTTSDCHVILIAIANAMDLPERFMRGRIASRLGWDKIVFESYTSSNLEAILEARLGKELMDACFDKASIVIATKRIGRTTGDARRILDTCRLAINKAIEMKKTKVIPAIIDKVGFENLDIQRREYIVSCPPAELLILKSILNETARVGEDHVDTSGVYKQLVANMKQYPQFDKFPLGPREYSSYLVNLGSVDLIYLENNKPLFKKMVQMKDRSVILSDHIRTQQIKF